MKKTLKINNIIFTQIKHRYKFYDDSRVYNGIYKNKTIVDTFYPHNIARHIVGNNESSLRLSHGINDSYALSEQVAEDYGSKMLHISELVTMLGYTKTEITKILQKVKNNDFNIILAGAGGTGSNFLHWLFKMSEWTGKARIFNMMYIYDPDTFDIPNMLRIPFKPEFHFETAEQQSAYKVHCLPKKFNILSRHFDVCQNH